MSWTDRLMRVLRSRYQNDVAGIQRLLDTLTIPDPWDLEQFVAGLAERNHGRRVMVVWAEISTPPHSLLVSTPATDVIVAAAGTSLFHRHQLVLREVGHVLLGQPPDASHDEIPVSPLGWERLRRHAHRHPEHQDQRYDLFGFCLLERVAAIQAAGGDARRAAALRAAALLEGRLS